MSGKTGGLGHHLYVAGFDLSGDINSLDSISTPVATIDVTGIDKFGTERLPGLRDGMLSFTSYFDPGVGKSHPLLKLLPRTDDIATYTTGSTVGLQCYSIVGKQLNYDGNRNGDGSFTLKSQVQGNAFGADWGELLTAGLRTDSAATTGATQNDLAATSFGFQAYLHITTFTGTDVTIKLQDSADSSTWADVASGGFAQNTSTSPSAQRIAVGGTATLRQYVRATSVTTGGFTSCTFLCTVTRNMVAVRL